MFQNNVFSLLSRFGKKSTPTELLTLDLGTSSLKTSVVQLPQELEENPKMVGDNVQPLGRTMIRGREIIDLDGVLESAAHSIEHALLAAGVQPDETVLGLSGNSIHYSGLTVRIQRPDPEDPVDRKELDAVVDRIEEETIQTAKSKISLDDSWDHLGMIITDYRIDDKFVSVPVDLTGKTLECIVLHGFWQEGTQKTVDMFSNQLGIDISMVWETAVARALRARESRESFLLVDVGGRVTEIVLVRGRRIISNTSINIGADDWTDALSRKMKISDRQAEKVKHSFQEGVLDQQRSTETREILESTIEDYVYVLAEALRNVSPDSDLPPVLYFTGEGSALNILKSKVLTFPWKNDGLFTSFPHVERLSGEFVNESLYYGYNLLS